jgi:ferredoxin
VRPAVWQFNWFSFAHTRAMIDAGYAAACEALDDVGDTLHSAGGVYPRRQVELTVDRVRCTGCGICATLAPDLMRMDADGMASAVRGPHQWSRADGAFVHECPVQALTVEVIDGDGHRHRTMEHKVIGE